LSQAAWDLATETFLSHLQAEKGLSQASVQAAETDLNRFLDFAQSKNLEAPAHVTDNDLRRFFVAAADDLVASSRARLLSTLRSFFRFLEGEDLCPSDPTITIVAPRRGRKLPDVLSINQVVSLLEAIDGSDPFQLRDRAMLEVLYGCGCRVSELCGLDVTDLDINESMLMLRGKGSKMRLVPVGEPAMQAVEEYLASARVSLVGKKPTAALFLNRRGGRLSRVSVWSLLKKSAAEAGLSETVSPHTIRHSYATHLLEGGADLRVVQELLGHADISTTEIYTHIDRKWLTDSWLEAHPRAKGK
jgi:integrase/recombinase XerD